MIRLKRSINTGVRGVEVTILNERVQYYDKDGKLITESVTDYSKKNILGEYATLDSFLRAWNSEEKKQAIIDELQERGVLLEALREASGNKDIDDFDLICHIAYDKAPLDEGRAGKQCPQAWIPLQVFRLGTGSSECAVGQIHERGHSGHREPRNPVQ